MAAAPDTEGSMPPPRSAKPSPRFRPDRLTPAALARMAFNPSHNAPRLRDVQDAPFTPPGPPFVSESESRLRAAVIADPDADAPRLAYAAWCDAQGDDRGPFIRAQFEGRTDAEPRAAWLAELEPWSARDVVFVRGFAERLSLAGRAFLSLGDGLFRTAPVRHFRLVAVQPFVGELARSPHVARLRSLDLTGNRIGPDGVRELGTSAHLGNLTALDLGGNDLGPDGVRELAAWPTFGGLRELGLASNGLTADALAALPAGGFDALTISDNPAGAAVARFAPGLRRLTVAGCRLGPQGATALFGGQLGRLEALDVSRNALGPCGAAALAADRSLGRLAALDLGFNDVGAEGAEALALADALGGVRTLDVRANRLDAAGAAALGGSTLLDGVRDLDASQNPLGDYGAVALVRGGNFTRLALATCGISDAGVGRMAASGAFTGVRSLSLAWNPCGDAAVRALARCPDVAGLRALDLTGTRFGIAGASALAGSPHLAGLRTLTLGENPRLPADVAGMLRERFAVTPSR